MRERGRERGQERGQERDAEAGDIGALGLRGHAEALIASTGEMAGRRVVDIGCGEGGLARALAAQGAEVTGIDPLIEATDWTHSGAGRWRLLQATGEALPFADGSVDLVTFVFSLHHLPAATQPAALAEARRVLGPSGLLYVAEPLAAGPSHEVSAIFHDETEVRARAAATLRAEAPSLFARHRTGGYVDRRRYAAFEEYAARMIAGRRFNGYREADVLAPAVRDAFEAARARHGGAFDQEVRIDLFGP